MQELMERTVNAPGFIVVIAVFVKQHVMNTVEKELDKEPLIAKEISSQPDCSPSAPDSTLFDLLDHVICKLLFLITLSAS